AIVRRMTTQEMRRMVGRKRFDGDEPGRYTNHDAEEPGGIVELGEAEMHEKVRISRKATESDLVIYLNVNFVPMDGGHKSVGTGLTDYLGLRAHHTPHAIRESKSYMEPRHSALHGSVNRIGRIIDEHVDVFHIETCLKQCFVRVKGQSDILVCGIPYISPYNVNSVLNPLLVQVMACGYFFNMNRGIPLVKKGGTLILTHPCMDEFDPVQHPSYIEF